MTTANAQTFIDMEERYVLPTYAKLPFLLVRGTGNEVFDSEGRRYLDLYGGHAVAFYYVNVGTEMARVEVPAWVAQDETLLGLSHALILDQQSRVLWIESILIDETRLLVIR